MGEDTGAAYLLKCQHSKAPRIHVADADDTRPYLHSKTLPRTRPDAETVRSSDHEFHRKTHIRNEPTNADRRGPTARAVDVAWPKRWSRRQACDHRRRSPGDRAQTGRAEGWRFVRRRVPMFEHTVRRNARTRQGQRRAKSRAHVLKKSNSAGRPRWAPESVGRRDPPKNSKN